MPTFIDESGDTGDPRNGGTPYFHVAAVWVPGIDNIELFQEKIIQLRRELGLPRTFEFKFSKTGHNLKLRKEFFTAAMSQEFRFAVSSIDKNNDLCAASRESQHWAAATELATALRPIYHWVEDATNAPLKELVVVDRNEDANYLRIIKQQFRGLRSRHRPGSSMIGKVCFRDSSSHEMIQLADMICGAVGLKVERGEATWYECVAERDIQRFRFLE